MANIEKHGRGLTPDPDRNARELAWWETNGALMASVWDYDDLLSRAVRQDYLNRAKAFLLGGRPGTVLEPGCGSGGIGRLIAGPDCRVTGLDWSRTMLDLARKQAGERGLDAHTQYLDAAGADLDALLQQADGVLIHAFLHHLDAPELAAYLERLRRGLRPGARVWIYEPTFYSQPPAAPVASPRAELQLALAQGLLGALKQHFAQRGLLNTATYDALVELFRQANENGCYLSPKEVPFDIDEFGAQLAGSFTVSGDYWSTINMYAWVLEPHIITDAELRRAAIKTVMPALIQADAALAQDPDYLRATLVRPNHAFHVWECAVPA